MLFIFIVPKLFKFCNHFIINSKKGTMFSLCYFQVFSIYFLLFLSKIGSFVDYFGDNYFFAYFTMYEWVPNLNISLENLNF